MNPTRLLIAFGVLFGLLTGVSIWGSGVYRIHDEIKEIQHIRGGDRSATAAAHDFVRRTLPSGADVTITTDACDWNDSMGRWCVSGTAAVGDRPERDYLCWLTNNGLEWVCHRMEINGTQMFPREE